jgi:hypothetical protein
MKTYTVNGTWTATMTDIVLTPTDRMVRGRRVYRLLKTFVFHLSFAGGDDFIEIPQGYEFDFASMPKFLQLILGNRDNVGTLEASLIHDWLCDNKQPGFYTNAKLRSVMFILGVPLWKRMAFYIGLQAFGYGSSINYIYHYLRNTVIKAFSKESK